MYTNYSAPGVFSLAANGFGPAASVNTLGKLISASNPAKSGDFPLLFVTGMGSVTPALADGVASSPNGQPLNWSDIYQQSALPVYFDGYGSPNIQFAGVVPGYAAGLYQINAQVPHRRLQRKRLPGHPHAGRGGRASDPEYRRRIQFGLCGSARESHAGTVRRGAASRPARTGVVSATGAGFAVGSAWEPAHGVTSANRHMGHFLQG